jgi:glycosyltransferase involved in cell wall biosynthesis
MAATTTTEKPRVLLVHPALAPYRLDQFNRLAALCELTVAFLYDNVWNHPFDQKALLAQAQFSYVHLLHGPAYKGRVLRWGLLRLIRRLRPELVIGYEFSFTTQFLMLVKSLGLLRARLGSTVDDSLDICHQVQSRLRALARETVVRRLDGLVVLSQPVADFYAERYAIAPSRIVVSPILQDPARLRAPAALLERTAAEYADRFALRGRRVLLFVGRFIPEKGLDGFLQTLAPVLLARPDAVLVLVGDGAERQRLQDRVTAEGLERQVLLPGRYEGAALHAWYLCASGFVLPSLYEPFGAVVDEALIFGLKVLCSQAAGSAGLALAGGGAVFDPLDLPQARAACAGFLDGLPALVDVSLAERPARRAADPQDFRAQWGKLLGT